jgi:hypothetical protein
MKLYQAIQCEHCEGTGTRSTRYSGDLVRCQRCDGRGFHFQGLSPSELSTLLDDQNAKALKVLRELRRDLIDMAEVTTEREIRSLRWGLARLKRLCQQEGVEL